jgi:translation initiation factor 1A
MPKQAARRGPRGARPGRATELQFAELGQGYGRIVGVRGGRRFGVLVADGETQLGTLRGAIRPGQRVTMGDVVLYSERDYQPGKLDILLRYTPEEVRSLRGYGEIPDAVAGRADGSDDDEADVVFTDDCGWAETDIDAI